MRIRRLLLLIAIPFLIYPNHAVAQQNKHKPSAAIAALIKAAEQGDATSQFVLGSNYYFGIGVFQDYTEAMKWYRKAANQGEGMAQFAVGGMYANGTGVVRDYAEAMKWYRKAADQGGANAQYNLGAMYADGMGVVRDYAEAVKWYRKAADQGDAKAQLLMGRMYYKGTGVSQDYILAYVWWNLCAAGPKGQVQETAAKERDKVGLKMTPRQIAEAKRLAREWKPKKAK